MELQIQKTGPRRHCFNVRILRGHNFLKILRFDSYSEAWLSFILNCRSGNDTSVYDLVVGGVANDKVFNTVELYFDGLIDKSEALKRLQFEQPKFANVFPYREGFELLAVLRSEKYDSKSGFYFKRRLHESSSALPIKQLSL